MNDEMNEYIEAMDELSFSAEEKERMISEIAMRTKGALSVSQAQVVQMPRRRTRWPFRAVAAAAFVAALGFGSVLAYAEGNIDVATGYVRDIFTGAPADTEVVGLVGCPVGASATCNGVRITADAVYGDLYNYTAVFTVEREDGSSLGIDGAFGSDGDISLLFENGADLYIDGVRGAAGLGYFYDANPDDNAIQYVAQLYVVTPEDDGIVGRTARIDFGNIVAVGPQYDTPVVLAEGEWSLKFKMNYRDSTIQLLTSVPLDAKTEEGRDVKLTQVAVSALGVSVNYTIDGQLVASDSNGKESAEARKAFDAIAGLPIAITFADGTTFDATNSSVFVEANPDGSSTVHKGRTFDRIVDTSDIAYVTVGETVIEVPSAGSSAAE